MDQRAFYGMRWHYVLRLSVRSSVTKLVNMILL